MLPVIADGCVGLPAFLSQTNVCKVFPPCYFHLAQLPRLPSTLELILRVGVLAFGFRYIWQSTRANKIHAGQWTMASVDGDDSGGPCIFGICVWEGRSGKCQQPSSEVFHAALEEEEEQRNLHHPQTHRRLPLSSSTKLPPVSDTNREPLAFHHSLCKNLTPHKMPPPPCGCISLEFSSPFS